MSLDIFTSHVGYREKFINNNLKFSLEVKDFLKEIAEIELEFSKKIESVCKKYQTKRLKNLEKRTKSYDELNTFSSATTAPTTHDQLWNKLIMHTESTSRVLQQLAESNNDAAHSIKSIINAKYDEKKKYLDHFEKLGEIQDKTVHEVEKTKNKYIEAAQSVEVAKSKHTMASDPKQEKKLKTHWEESISDCHNNKNEYLIQIAGANASEEYIFNTAAPRLINDMEELGTLVLYNFRDVMGKHLANRLALVESLVESYRSFDNGDNLLNVAADTEQFLSKAAPLPLPTGKSVEFQSCTQWVDTAKITQEPPARNYLQNVSFKLEKALSSFDSDIITRENSIDSLKPLFFAYIQDNTKGDPESIRDKFQAGVRELTYVNINKAKLAGELNLLISEIGEFDAGALPHDLKPKSFALPSTCDCCKGNLWELGKGGLQCSDCGFKSHTKCELKTPLNCISHIRKSKKLTEFQQFVIRPPNVQYLTQDLQDRALQNIKRLQSKALSISSEEYPSPVSLTASPAQTTKLPLSPSTAYLDTPVSNVSSPSPVKHIPTELVSSTSIEIPAPPPPPPEDSLRRSSTSSRRKSLSSASVSNPNDKVGVAAYDYTANADDEVSITEGDTVKIVSTERDGWALVKVLEGTNAGKEGLVPSSYIETEDSLGELPQNIPSSALPKDARSSTIRSVLNKEPSWLDEKGEEINKEVTVLFDYEKTADDDFSLYQGEKIFVKSGEQDGWIYASNGKEEGYVPVSYLDIS